MLIEDETFTGPLKQHLQIATYENCVFNSCDLSDADLSHMVFVDCIFNGCNTSMAKLHKTVFRDVQFKECKMLGLLFYQWQEQGLALRVDDCNLSHSSFYKTKIRKTIFARTQLNEVDFTECDLHSAVFDHCDLAEAKFENSLLEKADFRTAFHYSIDPALNKIKKAKFSMAGIAGLLDKYDIEIEP